MLNYQLTDADRAYWKENHHLVLRSRPSQIPRLKQFAPGPMTSLSYQKHLESG